MPHTEIQGLLEYGTGRSQIMNDPRTERYKEILHDEDHPNHDYCSALVNIVGNYDLPIGDFTRLANWGVYKGGPVIIDIGLSNDVFTQYYR